jgi:hypothetical protein
LLRRLLATAAVRKHYIDELPRLTDELAVLAALDPALFGRRTAGTDRAVLLEPQAGPAVLRALTVVLRTPRPRAGRAKAGHPEEDRLRSVIRRP